MSLPSPKNRQSLAFGYPDVLSKGRAVTHLVCSMTSFPCDQTMIQPQRRGICENGKRVETYIEVLYDNRRRLGIVGEYRVIKAVRITAIMIEEAVVEACVGRTTRQFVW